MSSFQWLFCELRLTDEEVCVIPSEFVQTDLNKHGEIVDALNVDLIHLLLVGRSDHLGQCALIISMNLQIENKSD